MSERTVYVIGLDGIPPDLFDKAAEENHIPNLERIQSNGVSGTTKTVAPPLSMAAWSSFATGRDPGEHGIYNFMLREQKTYRTKFADADELCRNSIPLWDYLDARGVKTGTMNLMPGYPPSQTKGFHIGDLVTSPTSGGYMYPSKLDSEIESAVGKYELMPYNSYTPSKSVEDLDQYLEDLFEMAEKRVKTGKHLIENTDCRVYSYVFSASDSIQHCLAHIMDRNHPQHEKDLVDEYSSKPLELLEIYDRFMGWLDENINKEDTIIVLSDHGHSSVYKQINLNSWLYNNGYITLSSSPWTKLKIFGYNNLFEYAEKSLRNFNLFDVLEKTLAQSVSDSSGKSLKDILTISRLDYDWDQTTAYTIASGGQIYINTYEDHPVGSISNERYIDFRESLRQELLNITDPDTGEQVIESVYNGEEIYGNKFRSTRPDLVALPADKYQIQYPQTMKTKKVFSTPPKPGSHTSEADRTGIFLASGGGVRSGNNLKMSITDYAPTIMALLSQPVPKNMTGDIRTDVFNISPNIEEYDGQVYSMRALRNVIEDL
jgi:predicted AlkP superfamily phosphohydrolase/phosphomutase